MIDTEALTVSLYQLGAVQFGEFRLRSGETSPVYLDLRLLTAEPATLRLVAQAMAARAAPLTFDRLAAIPMAGLPIGVALSLEMGVPLLYPRPREKDYGISRYIEGSYQPGDTVLVIDDVITRAHSKLEALGLLEAVRLKISDLLVVIDREMGGTEALAERGYRVHHVLTLQEVLDTLLALGRIPHEQHAFISAWLAESRSSNRYAP